MSRFLASLSCLLLAVSWLPAQPPKESALKRLELTPAQPPIPALRFSLLPELREQTPGNGAVQYRKAGDLIDKIPPVQAERSALHELMLSRSALICDPPLIGRVTRFLIFGKKLR